MPANDTLAPNALTTVTKMKRQLGITAEDTSQDEDIADLINAVSEYIERFCDRKFGINTVDELREGNGSSRLLLKNYPVVSVASIVVNGTETLDSSVYKILHEEGILYYDLGWQRASFGPFVLSFEPLENKLNIKVNYTYGFVLPKDGNSTTPRTLPYDLETCAAKMVKLMYNDVSGTAGMLILKSEKIGDWQAAYDKVDSTLNNNNVSYDIMQTLLYWRRKA